MLKPFAPDRNPAAYHPEAMENAHLSTTLPLQILDLPCPNIWDLQFLKMRLNHFGERGKKQNAENAASYLVLPPSFLDQCLPMLPLLLFPLTLQSPQDLTGGSHILRAPLAVQVNPLWPIARCSMFNFGQPTDEPCVSACKILQDPTMAKSGMVLVLTLPRC